MLLTKENEKLQSSINTSMDYDLLDALLEDCTIDSQENPSWSTESVATQEPENPIVIPKFTVTYDDHLSIMPNVIGRYRFKDYTPPKPVEIEFIPPFIRMEPEKNYQKQVFQSMDRIRLRKAEKYDTKVKERKKKQN